MTGSAGDSASITKSVISEPAGRVNVAPTSVFGDNRPACGFDASKPLVWPNQPLARQSNRMFPVSGEMIRGSWIEIPSPPSTRTSKVMLSITAPGANSMVQSTIAGVPFAPSAPVALSSIQPVSTEPSMGQIVPFAPSWALATGAVRIGTSDESNIRVHRRTALEALRAGP